MYCDICDDAVCNVDVVIVSFIFMAISVDFVYTRDEMRIFAEEFNEFHMKKVNIKERKRNKKLVQ